MMSYYIYKLKFLTPVRFGRSSAGTGLAQSSVSCHADTFFSALCQEWASVFGRRGFEELIEAVRYGQFLLSDLCPWSGLELYLPKPALPPLFQRDAYGEEKSNKKLLKKLEYIPASRFLEYLDFLREGVDLPWLAEEDSFACEHLVYRASVGRDAETLPYPVSAHCFREDSGLYFILHAAEEWRDKLDYVIESLGVSGIGGKRSSGLGKFELYDDSFEVGLYDSDCILEELLKENGIFYMSLSVLAPARDDLDIIKGGQSYYTLVKRTGFVASPAYAAAPLKRKPVVMLAAGSCFEGKPQGRLLDVSDQGGHAVYRYGKGLYLGVKV